jgi:RNA polymerase sigma-70 factor (ECF subfamily)
VITAREVDVAPAGSDELDQEQLYRDIGPGLWRAIYVYAGARRDIADDAVAEAFTRAMEAGDQIRDPKAWLYRVAFRAAAAELKRGSGESVDHERPPTTDEPPDLLTVMDALRQLPPNQRAAIVLHYRLDLSVRQIAEALGIAPATVRVHLHRGRNRLRELLKETDDD